MTLFLLTLAATGCLLAGIAFGYHFGHQDGYDKGWVARSYTPTPRWLELVRHDQVVAQFGDTRVGLDAATRAVVVARSVTDALAGSDVAADHDSDG